MKFTFSVLLFLISLSTVAQDQSGAQKFWKNLQKHCGKSFEGEITEGPANDDFRGKKLVMHVRSCDENRIRIPFFVGDDKSRTWILTYENDRIQLKHDHRHEDGTEDKITQYGGKTTNSGLTNIQFFAADQETADLIPAASNNVWWITLDEKSFTYNLRRIGSDRLFSVRFDLTKATANPSAPWGWKN
ncbi:hypothetical protein [Daejeonella oryzae]|uniref:hypothetical protein n=1 Tax=Daejeonella oryzae TaxID=1122943 RepID=UPI00040DEFEA|nr:hypothetical protein [Daejeonella oryzae]